MKDVSSIFLCLLMVSLVRAADPPATAPADLPGDRFDSKFDLQGMAKKMVAQRERDPIAGLAQDMASVTNHLSELNTSTPVQPDQQQIVVSLDALIKMLEEQQKNGTGVASSGANPTSPLPDSMIAGGPGGQGDMHDPNASARLWGQLPPKQREQILQSQNEGFPPGFETVLSSYYKRLASENADGLDKPAADSVSASAGPTTQPK